MMGGAAGKKLSIDPGIFRVMSVIHARPTLVPHTANPFARKRIVNANVAGNFQ